MLKDKTSTTRRRILKLLGIGGGIGIASYSYRRGIRFPELGWESKQIPRSGALKHATLSFSDLVLNTATVGAHTASLRAFSPEPSLKLELDAKQTVNLNLVNMFPDAKLEWAGENLAVAETTTGISRKLHIECSEATELTLQWRLPPQTSFKFASIGDTGGDLELQWCIKRAHQLGAKFLLHLGDINYQAGDYDNAIRLFNESPIPCYISIGNHDFHENGNVYHKFLNELGPLNHQFVIGKTRFANLDTAAAILPYGAGHRGALMQRLVEQRDQYSDTVAFTHRPLHDPIKTGDHDIGSEGERDWLIEHLKKANITTLLSGHIHIFDRTEFHGIDNIIIGQGLGHQDLIVGDNRYSKIAIGNVSEDGKVSYQFEDLLMPMEIHCHPRTDIVKDSLRDGDRADLIQQIDRSCL